MAVPTYDKLMRPILVRATKEPITRRSMTEAMVGEFKLTDEERAELLPSGSATYINNRVGWAMTFLTKAKLIKKVEKFTYRATETAAAFLKKHPNGFSDKDLKSIEGYEAAWEKKAPTDPKPQTTTSSTATPEDLIGNAINQIGDSLRTELLDQLLAIDPFRFEQIVIDLLFGMGYGGSREEAAQVTKKSGDEGIDGIINEDRLGLDVIYVQAKRWQDTVGRKEIQSFVGALAGKQANKDTYYEDLQNSVGCFDFVLANPPFNVSKIDKERLAGDPRYPFGIPRTDNGNYLWIQHFHSALNKIGRAGFVMANSQNLPTSINRDCYFSKVRLRIQRWVALNTFVLWGIVPVLAVGQINNAGSPIVFSGGNIIDTATISAGAHSGFSTPDIHNPVQILGTGGSLIGSSSLSFLNAFTGPGNLTLNLGSSTSIHIGYSYYPSSSVATFPNGFTLQSGQINFRYGTSIVHGDFSVTGDSRIQGNAVFTGNTITGTSGVTLNGGATFAGAGPNFIFDSDIGSVISTNTSGTQVFGGTVSGVVQRRGPGGTSVFYSPVDYIYAYGGTAVLSGSNGSSSNGFSSVFLDGGSVVLNNTLANNNSRISGTIRFYGGDLTLLGVNGGSTVQNLPVPAFYEGLNRIKIASGSGAGSSASLNFGGQATSAAGKFSLDFQGLNSTSKVFFSGQSPGAIGAWSTVDGREFAGYDSANGVQSLSAAGRPAQISTAPANSYVLGSGSQAALTGNKSLAGVTMPIGASLNLGGKELTIGGWIQNGSAGSISNGILKGDYIHFTTNSDLTTNTPVDSTVLLKNGLGTLTLNGSYVAGQCYVNTGTLALNLGSPMGSLQGQSTFVIGKSSGEIGSATLSLLGDNQFVSNPANGYSFVGVQVRGAGQFKLNGHNATVSFLQVNGGVVDMGGATVSTTNIYSSNPSSTGEIKNGTLQLTSTSNPVRIEENTYQDALTVSSKVLSSGSLSKTGPGILVLKNASNSFGNGTLGLLLSEGTVALANSGASGSTNQSIQFDGGGLRGDSNGTLILTNPVTGGSIVTSGSDMTFSGGYRQTTYGGDFHVSNTLLVNGYAIDGGNNYSSKTGTGTLILAGVASGTTTNSFRQRCGTLRFGSNTPLPSGMILNYWGGMLEAANGTRTISNKLLISDDITFAGSQDLNFNASSGNAVDPNQGISERRFYINGTGRITINNLTNGQGSRLTKVGPGTLIVSGNPSGFAATGVNEGTLRVKNSDATGAVLGAISVKNQGILGGTGIVKGLTTVVNGGALDPGDDARGRGTLNFRAGLTLNSGSIANFDLGATTGNDLIQITVGTFNAPPSGLCTVHLYNSGDFGPGTYTLISWTNSSTALASKFSLGTVVPGYNYNLFISGNSLCVSVTALPPLPAFRSIQGLASDGSQDLLCPAGDGSPNLLKYAFNMLGSGQGQAASLGIPNAAVVGPAGTAGLPVWTVDVNGLLNVTYIRRKSSSSPGITYSVGFTDSLSSWAVNPLATESVTSIDSNFERVTLTDSVASTLKRFGRIRITAP